MTQNITLRQRLAIAIVVVTLFLSALASGLAGGPRVLAAVNWNGPNIGTQAVNWN